MTNKLFCCALLLALLGSCQSNQHKLHDLIAGNSQQFWQEVSGSLVWLDTSNPQRWADIFHYFDVQGKYMAIRQFGDGRLDTIGKGSDNLPPRNWIAKDDSTIVIGNTSYAVRQVVPGQIALTFEYLDGSEYQIILAAVSERLLLSGCRANAAPIGRILTKGGRGLWSVRTNSPYFDSRNTVFAFDTACSWQSLIREPEGAEISFVVDDDPYGTTWYVHDDSTVVIGLFRCHIENMSENQIIYSYNYSGRYRDTLIVLEGLPPSGGIRD